MRFAGIIVLILFALGIAGWIGWALRDLVIALRCCDDEAARAMRIEQAEQRARRLRRQPPHQLRIHIDRFA